MPPHPDGLDPEPTPAPLHRGPAAWLASQLRGRPGWMNGLMLFCAYMAAVYVPWDLFGKPLHRDEEVWFGVLFTGVPAKLGALLHWAVYAAGAHGFRHMRGWMWPWASLYVAQVAFGMLIWNGLYGVSGLGGWLIGLVAAAVFGALAVALWRAAPLFGAARPPLRERYGEWALVTGASAGIGAEFARALAREGVSCVLCARREDRLRELAAELENDWQVHTRVVAVDLADPDGPDRLADAVRDLDLAILVNNAGVGYQGRFEKQDVERLRDLVQLNCAAPVVLTGRLLPALRARSRAALIFVGSVAGRQPLPLHAAYAASKSFDLLFGEALAVELAESRIDVLVVEPGVTETEFQQAAGELAHPGVAAAEVVRVALDALGRQSSVVEGWWNWLRANFAGRLLPRSLAAHVAQGVMARQTRPDMR